MAPWQIAAPGNRLAGGGRVDSRWRFTFSDHSGLTSYMVGEPGPAHAWRRAIEARPRTPSARGRVRVDAHAGVNVP